MEGQAGGGAVGRWAVEWTTSCYRLSPDKDTAPTDSSFKGDFLCRSWLSGNTSVSSSPALSLADSHRAKLDRRLSCTRADDAPGMSKGACCRPCPDCPADHDMRRVFSRGTCSSSSSVASSSSVDSASDGRRHSLSEHDDRRPVAPRFLM